MSCDICPTAGFLEAARTAIKTAPPAIIDAAEQVLADFAAYRPTSRTLDVRGHEVVLTQQHVSLTVMYGPHAEAVKQDVLGILTKLPEFERLPEVWHHRI